MLNSNPECLVCKSLRVVNQWTLDTDQILEQLDLEWGLNNLKGNAIQQLKNAKKFTHLLCLDCSCGFWYPTISGDAEFYESISSTYVDYRWDKSKVVQHIRRSNSTLDVGSGPNPIFKRLKQSSKKNFVSLDINPFVNESESEDHTKISDFDALVESKMKFKQIVALHFLEHVDNPAQYFKELSLLLESTGSIWISVPNRDRLDRVRPFESLDTPPHHVTTWNLESLENFARLLDLEIVNAWASKGSSKHRAIRVLRRYRFIKDFSRVTFHKIPLRRKLSFCGFQILVELKPV